MKSWPLPLKKVYNKQLAMEKNKVKIYKKKKPFKSLKVVKKFINLHCIIMKVSRPFNGCRGPKKIRRRK